MLEMYDDTSKDNTIKFEELGVDQLFIDEAHEFKNLGVITKMGNVAGLSKTQSKKAFDLYVKAQYITQMKNGHGVVFATGTPISNSMVEMFTMQRYLASEKLKEAGLILFDAWASTFGEIVSAMEISPDGSGYRVKQRFSKFYNLPELLTMFREFADVYTADMLELPVPKLKGGKPIIVTTEATNELKEYIDTLVDRSDDIRNGRVKPNVDNMLLVTNEGRKAALDIRLVKSNIQDNPLFKVNKVVEKVFNVWKETAEKRLAQLVFCDLSTPGSNNFDVYNDIKAKLIERNVPPCEIAFIHDANTDDRKSKLFNKVRSGEVRVLIGSTPKMGAGTNVQDKLIALHHVDAPWRPSDIEQREGRLVRQGNTNPEVEIYRYVTKGSFDAYMWQTIETKSRFINQIMNGKTTVRSAEDIDAASLSYAEVKALASGNPLVLEKMEVDSEVHRLHVLRSQFKATRYRMQDELASIPNAINNLNVAIENHKNDIKQRKNISGNLFNMTVEGINFTDRKESGEAILACLDAIKTNKLNHGEKLTQEIGRYAGFKLFINYKKNVFVDDELLIFVVNNDSYSVEPSALALKTIDRIDNAIYSIEEDLQYKESRLQRILKSEKDLNLELSKSFDKEEDLQKLLLRQAELNRLLDKDKTQEVIDGTEEDVAV